MRVKDLLWRCCGEKLEMDLGDICPKEN